MFNRRLQNFYHKQKKGLFVVLLVLLMTFFQLKQVSSTTIAYGASLKSTIVPQPSYIVPPSPTWSWTPGPSPGVTIYPQPTNVIPPNPTLIPGTTSFPISTPIMVTLTPTYTPTVTPTTTPQPTLPIHKSPVITTTSLPKGSLLKNYLAYVEGYDEDANLNLTMKITGLPLGLSSKICSTWIDGLNRKNIRCAIEGKPLKMGVFNVNVDLYDNISGQIKILKLTIGLR